MPSRVLAASFVLVFSLATASAQERSPFDPDQFGVVYDVPAMRDVVVEKNVTYHRTPTRELSADIARPKNAKGALPGIVFLNGVGDHLPDRVKEWGQYTSWPRLVATQGFVGVSMDCDGERIPECFAALFAFLERDGAKHGIDAKRLGVFACSANVTEASRFLLREGAPKSVLAAVFYYGLPEVATARRDLPVFSLTAEGDLARSRPILTDLWPRILAAGAPWTFEVATGMPHAFDCFQDDDTARRTIQRTLAFWKSHLEPVPQPSWKPSPERAIVASNFGNGPERTLALLGEWIAAHPDSPHGYAERGLLLTRVNRGNEGKPDLERALALGSDAPGVHGMMGMILAGQNKNESAVEHMRKAIAGGWYGSELYGTLGHALLVLGRNEEAVQAYERSIELGIPPGPRTLGLANYNLACGYARLGRVADALGAIERAVEQHFGNRATYEGDQDLKPLREEERFLVALDRLGAPR